MSKFVLYPEFLNVSWIQTEKSLEIRFRLPENIISAGQFKKNVNITPRGIKVGLNGEDTYFIDEEFYSTIVVDEDTMWEKIEEDLIFTFQKGVPSQWNYLFRRSLNAEEELSVIGLEYYEESFAAFKKMQTELRIAEKEILEEINKLAEKPIKFENEEDDGSNEYEQAMSIEREAKKSMKQFEEQKEPLKAAFNFYTISAQKGNVKSRTKLYHILSSQNSVIYSQKHDMEKAMHYLRLAALDNEDDWAQFAIARVYRDKKIAAILFQQAAKNGNGSAMYELGAMFHLHNKELEADDSIAYDWFNCGFKRCHPKCAYGLATIARVKKEYEKADKLFKFAAFCDPISCPIPEFKKEEEKTKTTSYSSDKINADINDIKEEEKKVEQDASDDDFDLDDVLAKGIDEMTPAPMDKSTMKEMFDSESTGPKIEEIHSSPLISSQLKEFEDDGNTDLAKSTWESLQLSREEEENERKKLQLEESKKGKLGGVDQMKATEPKKEVRKQPGWLWWTFQKVVSISVPMIVPALFYKGFFQRLKSKF